MNPANPDLRRTRPNATCIQTIHNPQPLLQSVKIRKIRDSKKRNPENPMNPANPDLRRTRPNATCIQTNATKIRENPRKSAIQKKRNPENPMNPANPDSEKTPNPNNSTFSNYKNTLSVTYSTLSVTFTVTFTVTFNSTMTVTVRCTFHRKIRKYMVTPQ